MDWTSILTVILDHSIDVLIIAWALERVISKVIKHMRFREEETTKRMALANGINPYEAEYRLRALELGHEEGDEEEPEPKAEERPAEAPYQQGYAMEQKR